MLPPPSLFTCSDKARARKGAATVEFAVVLPLFLLILSGIIEVGRLVNVGIQVRNAAREGAAQASTGEKSNSEVQTIVKQYLTQAGLPGEKAIVTVTNKSESAVDVKKAKRGNQLSVSVSLSAKDVQWVPVSFLLGESQGISGTSEWISRTNQKGDS